MAFFNLLLLLLLLQPLSAISDFLSPVFSPLGDAVCKEVQCGKGSCKAFKNSSFFECECDPGWKQIRLEAQDKFKFLPCIVPNCTLNSNCSNASSSAQVKARTAISSIFDPCDWVDCGGGSCNKTSAFSYSCNCDVGYYNLLNSSALACYKECAIGLKCSELGISLTNSSSAPASPAFNDNEAPASPAFNDNEGSSILKGRSFWVVMLIIYMAMIHLNQNDY